MNKKIVIFSIFICLLFSFRSFAGGHFGIGFQYPCKPGSQVFQYTGSVNSFSPLKGCRYVKAKIWGAGGGTTA
jgi:hypothetical protein